MLETEPKTRRNSESECEFAHEYESEQFFPALIALATRLAPMAVRAIGGAIGRNAARSAAKHVTRGAVKDAANNNNNRNKSQKRQREFESEYEQDPFITKLLNSLGKIPRQGEGEYESQFEAEYKNVSMSEHEAFMQNLAYRAAECESEAEAEAFMGALLPVSARLFPRNSLHLISSLTPPLIDGVASMTGVLHKSPKTRPLIRTFPYIINLTVKNLANRAQQGQSISQKAALRSLAANTAKILNNPKLIAYLMQKSHTAQHEFDKGKNRKCRHAHL